MLEPSYLGNFLALIKWKIQVIIIILWSNSRLQIIQFESHEWRISFEYEDTLLCDSSKLNNSSNKDWVKLNKKTIGKIWQLVYYNVYQCVTHETNAYKVWNNLQELYEKNNAQDKAFLD